jgi:hypothetical protein
MRCFMNPTKVDILPSRRPYYARLLHIKDRPIFSDIVSPIPPLRSQSVWIIARSRMVCLHCCCGRWSWGSLILWRRLSIGGSSSWLRSPLRGVDFGSSCRWLIYGGHRSVGIVKRRWHWMHVVLASLRIRIIVYGWVLVIWIVSRALLSIE